MKILGETIFVAVYGSIRLHPWNQGKDLSEDVYSLFVSRSDAMGWLSLATTDPSSPPAHPRWGMNDAGQDWSGAADTNRVAWLQVALVEPSSDYISLPLQPLVSCAKDVVNRVGELRLDGLQLLLPLHAGGVSHRELVAGRNWFGMSEPGRRIRIAVTLDGGESPVVQQQVESIAKTLSNLAAGIFHPGSYSTDQAVAVDFLPPVVDELWLGNGHHQVTFFGSLPEWSFDALGWTASLFAEACHRNRVETTVLVSISRSGASVAIGT